MPAGFGFRTALAAVALVVIAPARAAGGPVVVRGFEDESLVDVTGGRLVVQRVDNVCMGVPLVCDTFPTEAAVTEPRIRAFASTDGRGGSRLSVASIDPNLDVEVKTQEEGHFFSTHPVRVHLRSFFPGISLAGVFFAPASFISYEVVVANGAIPGFRTYGQLSAAGFIPGGADIGALFDAGRHRVTVPPFLVDVDFDPFFCCEGEFEINVTKRLVLHAAGGVELALGEIIDPFGITTTPLRSGLTFTAVGPPAVPEPSVFVLVGGGLCALLMIGRRCGPA